MNSERMEIVMRATCYLQSWGWRYLAEFNEGGSITIRIFPGLDEA